MIHEMMAMVIAIKSLVTLLVYVGLGMVKNMQAGKDPMKALPALLIDGIIFVAVLSVVLVIVGRMGLLG